MHLLLLSNAKREGAGYLEWAQPLLADFMAASAVRSVLFVPFAGVTSTPDDYTEKVRLAFEPLGIGVEGIHRAADPAAAVRQAQAVLVGGGSTWKLLREVRALRLLRAIRQRVLAGMPYAGWSAGANLACPTIMTTNDMPICDPGGFDALGLVPFQINPHYLDPEPDSTHMGETRAERIAEFHEENQAAVVGLRERAWIRVDGARGWLGGERGACIFRRGRAPEERTTGDALDDLLA